MSTFKARREQKIYKSYVTSALQIITENTAQYVKGRYLPKSYDEIINPPKPKDEKEDTRSCEEFALDVWKRAGIGKARNNESS